MSDFSPDSVEALTVAVEGLGNVRVLRSGARLVATVDVPNGTITLTEGVDGRKLVMERGPVEEAWLLDDALTFLRQVAREDSISGFFN